MVYIKMHINNKNWVHNHSDNLIKPEKIGTKNISIDKENFKYLLTYFTKCVSWKVIKWLCDKVFDKIKEIIGIEKLDYTKILINTDDKLSDEITLNELWY